MRPLLAAVVLLGGCDGLLSETRDTSHTLLSVEEGCPVRLADDRLVQSTWDAARGDQPVVLPRGVEVAYRRYRMGLPFDGDPETWERTRLGFGYASCRTRHWSASGFPPSCRLECE